MIRSILILLLLIGSLAGPAQSQNSQPPEAKFQMPIAARHLVTVGWNDFTSSSELYQNLQFAERDAQKLGQRLESRYAFVVEDLSGAGNKGPSDFLEAVRVAAARVPENAALIFFIASHGETISTDGISTGYVIQPGANLDAEVRKLAEDEKERRKLALEKWELDHAQDTVKSTPPADIQALSEVDLRNWARQRVRNPDVFDRRCIPVAELRDAVLASPARHVLIIFDSCFSGLAVAQSRAGISLRGDPQMEKFYDLRCWQDLKGRSRAVMTAGSAGERVYEVPDDAEHRAYFGDYVNHGIFTGALLHSLDSYKGAMTSFDLYCFVRDRVRGSTMSNAMQNRMSPLFRSFGTDADSGEFAFIPAPIDPFLDRVAQQHSQLRQDAGRMRSFERRAGRGGIERARRATQLDLLLGAYEATAPRSPEEINSRSTAPRWTAWFQRVKQSAEEGNADSMAALYYAYTLGLGTPRDTQQALRWAQEAKDTGVASGRTVFADVLEKGVGVTADQQAAAQLQKEAAAQKSIASAALLIGAGAASRNEAGAVGVLGGLWAMSVALDQMKDSPEKAMAAITQARAAIRQKLTETWNASTPDTIKPEVQKLVYAADKLGQEAKVLAQGQTEGLFPKMGPEACAKLKVAALDLLEKPINRQRLTAAQPVLEERADLVWLLYNTARAQDTQK